MTMNITVGTVQKVVQVSDTRVSKLYRNGKKEIVDDLAIKPVLLIHPNVRCFMTYCGLAIMAERTTSELMSELLVSTEETSGLYPYLNSFKKRFSEIFYEEVRRNHIDRPLWRTSIQFAGFEYPTGVEHPGTLFYGTITNHETKDGELLEIPNESFELRGRVINTPDYRAKMRGAYIVVDGINTIHGRRILNTKIRTFQRSRLFHRTSSLFIASELASMIRDFSNSKESEGLVSATCVGGMLTSDGEIGVYSFDNKGRGISISPIVIAKNKIIKNAHQNTDGTIKMV
jgi:hypothetical protein